MLTIDDFKLPTVSTVNDFLLSSSSKDMMFYRSPLEVTPAMKEGLAKSFVIAFPEFMVSTNDGRKPWVSQRIITF